MSNDIKVNFALVCDHAFLDKDGKVNIIGVFENIKHQGSFPFKHGRMYAVANFKIFKKGKYDLKIQVVHKDQSDKKVVFETNTHVEAGENNSNSGIILQIEDVEFQEGGEYEVQYLVDNEKVAGAEFKVANIANLEGE